MNTVGTPVDDLPSETKAEIAKSFVHLRFRGGRFEGNGGMPLAALGELQAIDELIQSLAKYLWRKSNGRQRMRQYPEAPILRVTRFAKGSSIPLIERDGYSGLIMGDPYEESRDLFERTFRSIISEWEIPEDFPEEYYDQLRRVGKTLKDDEQQEFLAVEPDGTWSSEVLTKDKRKQFWVDFDARSAADRMLVGRIQGMSWPDSFDFLVHSGQRLSGKSTEHWDDLHSALGTQDKHRFCRLYAETEVDYLGRIRKITAVKSVEVFEMEPNDWENRFVTLASCEENNGEPIATVATSTLERADLLIKSAIEKSLICPAVFPSYEGGTTLVWDIPKGRVSVYVEENEDFEVELVPHGPIIPFSTKDPGEAIAKVQDYIND